VADVNFIGGGSLLLPPTLPIDKAGPSRVSLPVQLGQSHRSRPASAEKNTVDPVAPRIVGIEGGGLNGVPEPARTVVTVARVQPEMGHASIAPSPSVKKIRPEATANVRLAVVGRLIAGKPPQFWFSPWVTLAHSHVAFGQLPARQRV
jgi:hypothetical protein